MSRYMYVSAICVAAMALVPVTASAHTGSVACGYNSVVFSYNNNFPSNTDVTEIVNGVSKHFQVPKYTAITDTVPITSENVTAYATWGYGSLAPVNLSCDYTPPTPLCTPTTVTEYVPSVEYVNVEVPGPTVYVTKTKIKTKTKIRWKTVYKFIYVHDLVKKQNVKPGGTLG